MHYFGIEFIEQTSLHNSVVSSAIFVLGFVLSATIADYKESERIPSEFASNIEDMYNDAKAIHTSYSKFNLDHFRLRLIDVLGVFREGTRVNRRKARKILIHHVSVPFQDQGKTMDDVSLFLLRETKSYLVAQGKKGS